VEQRREYGSVDSVDLVALAIKLFARKFLIFGAMLLCSVSALIYSLSATEWYEAKAVLVPSGGKSATGGFGQLSGVAALAGINLQSGGDGQLGIETLRSWHSALEFSSRSDVSVALAEQVRANSDSETTQEDLAEIFYTDIRTIIEDKKSGVVTVRLRWTDAKQAASWANDYVKMVNSNLQAQALNEASDRVGFLKEELASAELAATQVALSSLLEGEIQKTVVIRSNSDYAFRIVDEAVPPRRRVWPNRTFIVLLGAVVGLIIGCAAALVLERNRT
jgi:uncharacterized protein involved in exopolysaccharide biosynthesis